MEKPSPHYKLSRIRELANAGRVRATYSATAGAASLGIFDIEGMCEVIQRLKASDFYKSMTSYTNHRIWQDVYHASTAGGMAVYVKLTIVEDLLIVSFKEL